MLFFCYSCDEYEEGMIIILLTRSKHQFPVFTKFYIIFCYSCKKYKRNMIIILLTRSNQQSWIFAIFLMDLIYFCFQLWWIWGKHDYYSCSPDPTTNFEFAQFFWLIFISFVISMITKGQVNEEWIHEVIFSPKKPTSWIHSELQWSLI